MKRILRFLAVFLAAVTFAVADEKPWLVDLEAARTKAKAENKPILMNFTGSDWCEWCARLKVEVLDTPEFLDFAKDHLVLLEVDFPRTKELPSKQKEQNQALDKKYCIEGYPTIVLADASGEKLAETGYREGGGAAFVEYLKRLLAFVAKR